MKKLTIHRKATGKFPNAEDVWEFEKSKNFKLPKEFVQFLMDPEMQPLYTVEDTTTLVGFEIDISWYGWEEIVQTSKHLFDVYENDYVSFGHTFNDWQWVIGLRGTEYGKVFMYACEDDVGPTFAANSFAEFVDSLYEGG